MANFEFWCRRTKFLLIKLKSQNFFYSYDPFKKWSNKPKIQNLSLIHLPIYKKFFISGSDSKTFTNKVEIARVWLLSKVPLRSLGGSRRLDCGGLWRCRSDSRSRIIKNPVRSCPFSYRPFLAKFSIFGQIGIWRLN